MLVSVLAVRVLRHREGRAGDEDGGGRGGAVGGGQAVPGVPGPLREGLHRAGPVREAHRLRIARQGLGAAAHLPARDAQAYPRQDGRQVLPARRRRRQGQMMLKSSFESLFNRILTLTHSH